MHWPKNIAGARKIQEHLRKKVRITPFRGKPTYIAGVDAAFTKRTAFAAACLYQYPELVLVEQACESRKLDFPYIPGYLSFREGPAIIAALNKLTRRPDIVLVDGQGIAHPKGIGIASHIGVLLNIPTIGCAKTRLVGEYSEPGAGKGEWSALHCNGRTVGAVLRTRDNVNPVFVSPGHLADLKSSIRFVLSCGGKYRIPEPLRCADMLSKKTRAGI